MRRQTFYTVREIYEDEEYRSCDSRVWTFKTKGAAWELINFLNEHNEEDRELYVDEWCLGDE